MIGFRQETEFGKKIYGQGEHGKFFKKLRDQMSNDQHEISIARATKLLEESKLLFTEVFKHGTLVVEFYKPDKMDNQKPHERDEIYVVANGEGIFCNGGKKWNFRAGDFLFVPAGVEHRFEDFTEDFSTWVFFYGPVGGEK